MKYLTDYTESKLTALLESTGAFWAFSDSQFNEQMKKGVQYTNAGAGLICPIDNVIRLKKEMDKIYTDSIQEDINENGKNKIILRELYNHECFYTGEFESVIDSLKAYGISETEISAAYHKEMANA